MCLGTVMDDRFQPVLIQLLRDPDLMVQYIAGNAIYNLPKETKMEYVEEIMQAIVHNRKPLFPIDKDDPLHIANLSLSKTLFYSVRDRNTKGILITPDAIKAIKNRPLFHDVIRTVVAHPCGSVRNGLRNVLKHLTREEVLLLSGSMIDSIIDRAPADKMFEFPARDAALDALTKYRIQESIPLNVMAHLENAKMIYLDETLNRIKKAGTAVQQVSPSPQVTDYLQLQLERNADNPERVALLQEALQSLGKKQRPFAPLKKVHALTSQPGLTWKGTSKGSLTVEATDIAGGELIYSWSLVSGPGEVQFSSPTSSEPSVQLALIPQRYGDYTIEVTVSDTRGLTEVSDQITIRYTPGG